ncbi:MAG: TPM domain-containing protein [Salinivirgaceae bacterium]|nr:TPM domain-containing protein [Salinivirgaceae bacterium]
MKRILLIITFLAVTITSFADVFDRPSELRFVVDSANAFTAGQMAALTAKLDSFDIETSTQIQIYTTTNLQGYDIVDFAQRLGEGWGVGKAGFDNGIVIVYVPKTDTTAGEVTIQTGYGIEPLIPDATCKRIIELEMIPCFKKDSVYEGFNRAVDVCISLTKGEFKANDYQNNNSGGFWDWVFDHIVLCLVLGMVGIWVLILLVVVIYLVCTGGGGGGYSIDTSSSSSSSRSYHSSHSSGSHRSYGGGHFGGGGARGRW